MSYNDWSFKGEDFYSKRIKEEKRIHNRTVRRFKKNRKKYAAIRVRNEVFFASREWRELRYRALLKHGKKCQCCGAKPPLVVLHVDHVKPRAKYPDLELSLDNLQVLCEECNMGKGAWDQTDHR